MISGPLDIQILQHTLRYLYDPVELKHSPLIRFLAISSGDEASAALRHVLIETIRTLKPSASLSQSSKAWRIYNVLTYRFIEQSTQKQVASELGLGIRQLRRLEILALETLAETLAVRQASMSSRQESALPEIRFPDAAQGTEQELELLSKTTVNELIEIQPFMASILHTVGPLFQTLGVKVFFNPQAIQTAVYGQAVPIRQGIINVLSAFAQSVAGGKIILSLELEELTVSLWATAAPAPDKDLVVEDQVTESVKLGDRLVALSGGKMELSRLQTKPESLALKISLPISSQKIVLALDDNLDALRLIERYLAGSAYRLFPLQDPSRLISMAEIIGPDVFLLDVMLPGSDGWELLGRLREHPQLNRIPVIISTILSQEPLALALGAAAFLRKPVSQEIFLQTLDRLLAAPRGLE